MENLQGKIISIARNANGARATIDVDAGVICPRCAEGKGCGAGVFGASDQPRRIEAMLATGLDVSIGDSVSLSLGSRNLLQAAIIVYGWPLFGAAAGAVLALFAGFGDTGAVLAALAGLMLGALLARKRLGSRECLKRFVPVVTGHYSGHSG
jgi:sigma-E factor negative regulatory protein RseC